MSRTRLLATLSIGIGLLAPLVLAEAVLRLLPVKTALHSPPVNERDPVRRFDANRDFTFSKDWDFKQVNKGHTNNYGFVNDQDYDSTAHTPLLAVIGDSYVEALMLPFPKTVQGRLAQCVADQGRVYSFGVSGAPLSQYLAEADYARSQFHPSGFVVVIVGNDFDESFRRYKSVPGFHYFRDDSNRVVLERLDSSPTLARRLLRHSALAQYFNSNLSAGGYVVGNLKRLLGTRPLSASRVVGNTDASTSPQRLEDSRRAIEKFLSALPAYSGVDPRNTVLMIDGMRPDLYGERELRAATGSFFDLMRRRLIERATARGYEVVDLQPRFIRRHAVDGARFEFPADDHWNGLGHEEAAAAVASSSVFRQLFPAACPNLAREVDGAPRP